MLLSRCGHWVMVEHAGAVQPAHARLPERGGVTSPTRHPDHGDELYAALRARRTVRAAHRARAGHHHRRRLHDLAAHARAPRSPTASASSARRSASPASAVQHMLDVHQPDFGCLTDRMRFPTARRAHRRAADPAARRGRDRVRAGARPARPGRHRRATCSPRPSACCRASRSSTRASRLEDPRSRTPSPTTPRRGVFVLGDATRRPARRRLRRLRHGGREERRDRSPPAPAPRRWARRSTCVAWLANTLGELGIPLKAARSSCRARWCRSSRCAPGDSMRMHASRGVGGATSVRVHR